MTPWTVAHQAPLSTGFSRQEYWRGLPVPSPGDLPDPGVEPGSHLLPSEPPRKPLRLPWVGKIPWRRKCNPLQYSCLENPVDRGAWWAAVHGVTTVRDMEVTKRTHTILQMGNVRLRDSLVA